MSNATLLSVWAGGIQDISVIATVLGTELCENHLDNILDHGYIYGSAVSLSMFGILSVSKWGIKIALGKSYCKRLHLEESGDVMKFLWDSSDTGAIYKHMIRYYKSLRSITINYGWINSWWYACYYKCVNVFYFHNSYYDCFYFE
jgi:hypothetical protein